MYGKAGSYGFWKHVISEIWIGSTETDGSRVEHFPRIHYMVNSRRGSKDDN